MVSRSTTATQIAITAIGSVHANMMAKAPAQVSRWKSGPRDVRTALIEAARAIPPGKATVKADRFRLDWEWSGRLGTSMRQAVLAEDWATVAGLSAQVGQKLAKVSVPVRHRLGTPWVGAWKHIKSN